jgi:hypothetical protein
MHASNKIFTGLGPVFMKLAGDIGKGKCFNLQGVWYFENHSVYTLEN